MAVPDITNLTPDELVTLIQQANAKYATAQAATATDVQTRRQSAAAAVHTMPWMSPRRSPSGRQWPRTRPSPCR